MASITLQGKPFHTVGDLPKVGSQAPDFTLTKMDLADINLKSFQGKKIILSIFPSVDTGTCANAERHFNERANQLHNTVALCVSADLPFAQKRFCAAEGLENIIPASTFRHPEFGKLYGVAFADGPLLGLLSRSVVVIDEKGKIIYTQQVPETTNEPDFDAVFAALS